MEPKNGIKKENYIEKMVLQLKEQMETKEWYLEGKKLHREDGPAIETAMETKNGIKKENYIEKMVLQLKQSMEPKNGIWKEIYIEKMVLQLKEQMEAKEWYQEGKFTSRRWSCN